VGEEKEGWIYFITTYLKVGGSDGEEDIEEHPVGNNSGDGGDLRL
jgi:hypothetical protein